jgi:hypothetical protein
MAVACAAIFVPFRAFLKPSIPHDLNNFTTPATENYSLLRNLFGASSSVVVKALCYKPEGRGFDN